MSVQKFQMLQIILEDCDIEPKEQSRVLVYINGVYESNLGFTRSMDGYQGSSCEVFVHDQDTLILELQQGKRSVGEQTYLIRDVLGEEGDNIKWIKFVYAPIRMSSQITNQESSSEQKQKQCMVLIRFKSQTLIGSTNNTSIVDERNEQCEYCQKSYNNQQSKQFPTVDDMVKNIKELKQCVEQQSKLVDGRVKLKYKQYSRDLDQIYNSVVWHSSHWCQHCIQLHMNDEIKKINEISKQLNSKQRSKSPLLSPKPKSFSSGQVNLQDTLNDRASTVKDYELPQSKKPQSSSVAESFIKDIFIKLQQYTQHQIQQNQGILDQTVFMVEQVIKENETLKLENRLLRSSNFQISQTLSTTTQQQSIDPIFSKTQEVVPNSTSVRFSSFGDLGIQTSEFDDGLSKGVEGRDSDRVVRQKEIRTLFEDRDRLIKDLIQNMSN